MTRKILALALAIMLCAACAPYSAARASDGDALIARRGMDGFNDSIQAVCALGDALWLLGYDGVYAYDTAAETLATYAWDENYTTARYGVYDTSGEKVYTSVCCIFAWREGLYALSLTSSVESGAINVELCAIRIQGGLASLEVIGEVDWQPGVYDDYFSVINCFAIGDVLCANVNMRYDALCLIPLDGSDMIVTDITNALICPYEDKLMAVTSERGDTLEYIFSEVNARTGEYTRLARLDTEGKHIGGAAWLPDTGRVLLLTDGRLAAFDMALGVMENIAASPLDPFRAIGLLTDNGIYAAYRNDGSGVMLRRVIGRGQIARELVIAEQRQTSAIEKAIIAYSSARPDMSIARVSADNVIDKLLTRSTDIDIYVLSSVSSDENALDAVLARGWAAHIDSEELLKGVKSMYPEFGARFIKDGKLIAVPLSAKAQGLGINIGALEALERTMDDVPANWADFFDYIGALARDNAARIIGEEEARSAAQSLLKRLLKDQALEIASGRESAYDTPEFRAALAAFERLDFGMMEENGLETGGDDYLLLSYIESVGVNGMAYDNEYDYYPLRLSVGANSPVYMPLQAEIAIINPASQNIDEAIAFLEAAWRQTTPASRAMMIPEDRRPLRDIDAYERNSESQRQRIANLQAQIDSCKGDFTALKADLEQAEQALSLMENWYWYISPYSLNWYEAHDDYVALETNGEISEYELYGLISKYLESGEGMDALISEIDRKAQMKRMEGY